MPGVKGHGLEGNWLLHACSSISSFEPATTMLLLLASTAMAGSFCLFCENGNVGLALVTFTELSAVAWAASGPLTITKAAADPSTSSTLKGFLMTLSLPAALRDQAYPAFMQARALPPGLEVVTARRLGTNGESPALVMALN